MNSESNAYPPPPPNPTSNRLAPYLKTCFLKKQQPRTTLQGKGERRAMSVSIVVATVELVHVSQQFCPGLNLWACKQTLQKWAFCCKGRLNLAITIAWVKQICY